MLAIFVCLNIFFLTVNFNRINCTSLRVHVKTISRWRDSGCSNGSSRAVPPSSSIRRGLRMLTMPPGALQGQRSSGPPKVVGELLKGAAEGTAATGRKRSAGATSSVAVVEQPSPSGAPAAAAMVLAKDMATGRKSSAVAGSQSPRAAARSSGIPIRPKPVPPSVSYRKTVVATVSAPATITADDGRKQQPKYRRPTSVERVKV